MTFVIEFYCFCLEAFWLGNPGILNLPLFALLALAFSLLNALSVFSAISFPEDLLGQVCYLLPFVSNGLQDS